MAVACPACGGELQFKSRFSAMGICPYCQSVLKRDGDLWRQSGKMAALPPDMSPFQIGTQGKYLKQPFEMIGQLKVAWQDGFWNEWYILEENGNQAWLAEAMGFLSFSHEVGISSALKNPRDYRVGENLSLAGQTYTISDIKDFECVGCVGELPLEFTTGMEGVSIDLLSTNDDCAYLEYSQNAYRFFKGKNVNFDQLEFSNLRELDGW